MSIPIIVEDNLGRNSYEAYRHDIANENDEFELQMGINPYDSSVREGEKILYLLNIDSLTLDAMIRSAKQSSLIAHTEINNFKNKLYFDWLHRINPEDYDKMASKFEEINKEIDRISELMRAATGSDISSEEIDEMFHYQLDLIEQKGKLKSEIRRTADAVFEMHFSREYENDLKKKQYKFNDIVNDVNVMERVLLSRDEGPAFYYPDVPGQAPTFFSTKMTSR